MKSSFCVKQSEKEEEKEWQELFVFLNQSALKPFFV